MDLNGDGHKDILSGSYSRTQPEMAGLFQVLWGQAEGGFKNAKTLQGTDGRPLIIPIKGRAQMTEHICTRPVAVDWDGDGDLDLVVGNFAGSFYLFTGEGKGKFQPVPAKLKSGALPLKISGVHSDPFVIDWDGDGDLDLLSGSSNGGVYWAENQAGKGKTPDLKPFTTLIQPGRRITFGTTLREKDLTGPSMSTRIWVDDVNADGKLDILVGDNVMLSAPALALNKAEFRKRKEKWEKDLTKAFATLRHAEAGTKERQKALNRFSKLYCRRSEFVTEERTGFVWLYLQQ